MKTIPQARRYWLRSTRATPAHPPNLGHTWHVQPGFLPTPVCIVLAAVKLSHLTQPRQKELARIGGPLKEELVNEALAALAAMDDEVFEFFELVQMALHLGVAPAGVLAHVTAAKTEVGAFHL